MRKPLTLSVPVWRRVREGWGGEVKGRVAREARHDEAKARWVARLVARTAPFWTVTVTTNLAPHCSTAPSSHTSRLPAARIDAVATPESAAASTARRPSIEAAKMR